MGEKAIFEQQMRAHSFAAQLKTHIVGLQSADSALRLQSCRCLESLLALQEQLCFIDPVQNKKHLRKVHDAVMHYAITERPADLELCPVMDVKQTLQAQADISGEIDAYLQCENSGILYFIAALEAGVQSSAGTNDDGDAEDYAVECMMKLCEIKDVLNNWDADVTNKRFVTLKSWVDAVCFTF